MYWRRSNHKYNAKPTWVDGIRFDSIAEAERYRELKLDPDVIHVDVHVPVTLKGGNRFSIDFVIYRNDGKEGQGNIYAEEVKGFLTQDFRRMRKLFDAEHPLAPLRVIKRQGKKWIEI